MHLNDVAAAITCQGQWELMLGACPEAYGR